MQWLLSAFNILQNLLADCEFNCAWACYLFVFTALSGAPGLITQVNVFALPFFCSFLRSPVHRLPILMLAVSCILYTLNIISDLSDRYVINFSDLGSSRYSSVNISAITILRGSEVF